MQYCVECGTENRITSRYCVKCKTLLVLTVFEKRPMRKRTKITIGVVATLSIVALALLVTPRPVSISVEVAVEAPSGGIFVDGCELSQAAKTSGADSIELREFGTSTEEGKKFPIVYFERDGACVAKAEVQGYATSTYELFIAGQPSGQIQPIDFEKKLTEKSVELVVTHSVNGSIILSDFYSGCRDTNKGPDCVIPANTVVQAQLVKNICYGKNSFSDFVQNGPQVSFRGLGTKLESTVKSSKGVPAIEDFKSSKVTCTFEFSLPPLTHDEQGYEVTVGKHVAGKVTPRELESNSWVYDFEFKN